MTQANVIGRRGKLAATRAMDKPVQAGVSNGASEMSRERLRASGAKLAAMKPIPRLVGNSVLTRNIGIGTKGNRRIPDAEMPASAARQKPARETLVMFMVGGQVLTATELLNSISLAARCCDPWGVKRQYDWALEIVNSASLPDTKLIQQLNARYNEVLAICQGY